MDKDENIITESTSTATTTTPKIETTTKNATIDIGLRSHRNFDLLPNWKECSYAAAAATSDRVIGGNKVTHGTYPWMVKTRIQTNN